MDNEPDQIGRGFQKQGGQEGKGDGEREVQVREGSIEDYDGETGLDAEFGDGEGLQWVQRWQNQGN